MPKLTIPDRKLLDACVVGDVAGARAALAEGANVGALNRDASTPLHSAVYSQSQAPVLVALLLTNGANVNAQDRQGLTPLHGAAIHSQLALARLLLEHGAQVDALDSQGNTPLWRAVMNCRDGGEMVKLLLQHGADPRKDNKHGISAQKLAEKIDGYDVSWLDARHS
jgi:ankyrin repeat protein